MRNGNVSWMAALGAPDSNGENSDDDDENRTFDEQEIATHPIGTGSLHWHSGDSQKLNSPDCLSLNAERY
jgi:hypothetical protein